MKLKRRRRWSSCQLLTNSVIQYCLCDWMWIGLLELDIGFTKSITRMKDLREARDWWGAYMCETVECFTKAKGHWCPLCLCKPEVLTANASYLYSPHPDCRWQKGRYSSACVTQLLWLLQPKALQLDKEMKPYDSTNKCQQRAHIFNAPFSLGLFLFLSPRLQLPVDLFLLEIKYSHSSCDLWCQILRNQWWCSVSSCIKCLTTQEMERGRDAAETIGGKRD